MKKTILLLIMTLVLAMGCKKIKVTDPEDDDTPDPIEIGSLYFDGNGDFLVVEDHDDLDLANKTYVLEAMVKPKANNYYQWFLSKAYLNDNMDYMLGIDRYNNKYRHISSSLGNDINAITAINGDWIKVEGVHNIETGTFSIYINGKLENTTNINSRSSKSNDNDLYIGARWFSNNLKAVEFLTGEIDYIKIWGPSKRNVAVSKGIELNLDLIAYWEMNELYGTNQVEDLTGNGHHATINGNPKFIKH
ncbi:MAG: hypothetical protein CVV25_12920 [Ignavibacteriae bacterium HGW-Ignavibacteriae-4]|nr:MAG: hypothetical protein CVV25_12920 [Ignavibacteriae bacterium HGW-Ignavibacteriae-4]